MKKFLLIIFLALPAQLLAADRPSNNCIKLAFENYSSVFSEYWTLIGHELKSTNSELYSEFSYLIIEQLNFNEMQKIKLSYLLENHPEALKLERPIFAVTPSYANYQNAIFRELNKIDRYRKLYLENQSYEHNIKMPDFERLQEVSQVISDIKSKDSIRAIQEEVEKRFSQPVIKLNCGS